MSGEPLRILQILRAPVGGLFRHVSDLTEELARRGHEIGVVADSLSSDELTAQRLKALSAFATLGVYKLPMPRLLGPGDMSTPYRVRRLGRSLRIDVLHGHGAKGGLNARFGRTAGQVALNTPHGGVLHFRPGSMAGRFFGNAERLIGGITDGYIFESAYAQRAFHAQIGVPPCREAVVHNGLAAQDFVPVTANPDAADFVFIGEFRDVKGIHYLFEAMRGLRRTDGRPATLVMAGNGPEWERSKAELHTMGLSEQVQLLGTQPARPTLARGRCLVVPSLAESLPYVVLEGTAAGLPLIATNVGGVSEIFGPTAGSLIAPADADALRRKMQAALDRPDLARAEAAERLRFITPRFSIARMADGIEAFYRELLLQRRSAPDAVPAPHPV